MSCLLLAIALVAADPKIDLQQYLVETDHLIRIAKYEEALERCIWFHDHALEHDPNMVGVRASFALLSWSNLASKYPPARKAMIDRRNQATKELLDGKGGVMLFLDAVALNRELKENDKTVELFEAKKLDLIRKHLGPLDQAFETIRKRYDEDYEKLAADWENSGRARDFLKADFERQVLRLIKYAVALGESENARQIQTRAIEVLDRESIRNAIPAPNMPRK